jgi:hypothetical protein
MNLKHVAEGSAMKNMQYQKEIILYRFVYLIVIEKVNIVTTLQGIKPQFKHCLLHNLPSSTFVIHCSVEWSYSHASDTQLTKLVGS